MEYELHRLLQRAVAVLASPLLTAVSGAGAECVVDHGTGKKS